MSDSDNARRDSLARNTTFTAGRSGSSKNPLLWGRATWAIEGVPSPEPPAKADDPFYEFWAVVRLARLDAPIETPDSWDVSWVRNGDSNYNLPATVSLAPLNIEVGTSSYVAEVTLLANSTGRLGGLQIRIPRAQRSLDAYRVARGVFDGLNMTLAFGQQLSIREIAILVWRSDSAVAVFRYGVEYPNLDLDLTTDFPSIIMQRFAAPWVTAIQSTTPLYSFLVLFSLLEFLMTPWLGALRAAYEKRKSSLPKRSYVLDHKEVGMIAPWMKGKTFHDLLTMYRHLRNLAGGAHFNFSIGPRTGTVRTDDEVACIRDLLLLAVKTMLGYTRDDLTNLIALGATNERELLAELQSSLDAYDRRKLAASKKTKKRR